MLYSGMLWYRYNEMRENIIGTIHGAKMGGTVPEYPMERVNEYPSQ